MPQETVEHSSDPQDFGDPASNPEAMERGKRLELAVKDAGGRAKVRRASGVPESTILGYEKGGEIKLSNAIALAQATGVRLEWLATGLGPRSESATQANTPQPAQPAPPSPLLSDRVDLERLVHAYRAARQVTDKDQDLVQLMLRFHDVLAAQDPSPRQHTTEGSHREPASVKAP